MCSFLLPAFDSEKFVTISDVSIQHIASLLFQVCLILLLLFKQIAQKMSEKRKRKHPDRDGSAATSEKPTNKEDDEQREHRRLMARELGKVELPESSEGLTAEKLNAEQKNVFKKECQRMYGHKFSTKRKLPASSLESATLQLQAKMKEKAALLKSKKKKTDSA